MNEKDIIRKYFTKHLNDKAVINGIGDDAAIVSPKCGHQLVITTDTMVEGKHFSHTAPAYGVGYKLMAANLSDIAAMGATPRWATLNLTLNTLDPSWLEGFSNGLLECAHAHNVSLIGGDTTSGECLNVSIQLIAEAPINKAMLRSNAQINDCIFVTGVIGNAASALHCLQQNDFNHEALSTAQHTALYQPPSRIDYALELAEIANAAIDISDGLLNELEIICHASNVGATLQLNNLPYNHAIDIQHAITGGEDYELLFTIPSEYVTQVHALADKHQCLVTHIGQITNTKTVELYQANKRVPYPTTSGYDHFQNYQ